MAQRIDGRGLEILYKAGTPDMHPPWPAFNRPYGIVEDLGDGWVADTIMLDIKPGCVIYETYRQTPPFPKIGAVVPDTPEARAQLGYGEWSPVDKIVIF